MAVLTVNPDGTKTIREYTQAEIDKINNSPPDVKTIQLEKVKALVRLEELGLYSLVEVFVNSLNPRAKILWKNATFIEKSNPLIQAIATELSWDESQVDQFFIEALGVV